MKPPIAPNVLAPLNCDTCHRAYQPRTSIDGWCALCYENVCPACVVIHSNDRIICPTCDAMARVSQ